MVCIQDKTNLERNGLTFGWWDNGGLINGAAYFWGFHHNKPMITLTVFLKLILALTSYVTSGRLDFPYYEVECKFQEKEILS